MAHGQHEPIANQSNPSVRRLREGGDAILPGHCLPTKQEYIQLKWDGRYWKRQHDRAVVRAAAFKQELELAQARIRDLEQRLYGKRSEKGTTASEAQAQAGGAEARAPAAKRRGARALTSVGFSPSAHRRANCQSWAIDLR